MTFITENWATIAPMVIALIYLAMKITPSDDPRWQVVDIILKKIADILKDKSTLKDDASGKSLSHKDIKIFDMIDSNEDLRDKVKSFINSKRNR